MVVPLFFILAILGCSAASALSLNLTSPISSPPALNQKNISALSADLQAISKVRNLTFDASCNGPVAGNELTKDNCQDAANRGIPYVSDQDVINYGDRSVGKFDVNLPQRYISKDGRCVIDVTLENIKKATPYYPFGVALAATFLVAKCVQSQNPPQGGTLENFDEGRNMRVVVHSYEPKVVCVDHTLSPDIRGPCQSLLDSMTVDKRPIRFGYTRDSTVRLPYSRVSRDGLCVMDIDTSGVLSDIASWRDFWEVGVALNGVCIRTGREGFQINIGAAGGLHMELRDNRNLGGSISASSS